jgi:purine-cytosine permease-like protein
MAEKNRGASGAFEDDAFVPVPADERHGWWKTSLVWAGSSISVPVIMIGSMLIAGLTMPEMILATVIGTAILGAVFCFQGMEGTDTGLPTVIVARAAFGREGAGVVVSFILAVTLVCWAGSDCQVAGAIMGSATGETDITLVVAGLGLPIVGLIVLVLATWTTMATDAYTGGLAVTSLLHMSGTKRSTATAVAGCLGIALAVFGIMDYFDDFLNIMAAAIPPIAGVMIADHWILRKGGKESWRETPGVNWWGVVALVVGACVALFLPVGQATVNGILTAMILYVIFGKVFLRNMYDMTPAAAA